MSVERSSSQFVKGAAILGLAGLISKLLGAVYRIPYQNIAGDIGLYVYMQVYPLYSTLLVLATAGFPIAISKIVSERLALGDAIGARRSFTIASLILGIMGLFFFILLFAGAPFVARMMGDEELILPLRAVAWSLPLVPLVSIMRGYFQGHQNMMPTGVSQVFEQLIRVIFILIAAYLMMKIYDDAYLAGTGAVFAALPGAVAAFMVLLFYWQRISRKQRRLERTQIEPSQFYSSREIVRKLFYYALPIGIGALVLPLLPLVDSLTVINMLQWVGTVEEEAKLLKGAYDRGQPLVQFGTFFASSLSLALVPAISEAVVQKQHRAIANRTEVALRLTFLLGFPASVGLALLAHPVNVMLYGDGNGTQALTILSFAIVFATLSITTSGILQGLGKVMLPARHLFVGVIVKLLLNLLLVPFFGISGAAAATVCAYLTSLSLNMIYILRYTGVQVSVRQMIIKPFMAVLFMAVIVFIVTYAMSVGVAGLLSSERWGQTVVALCSVAIGGGSYGIALLLIGALTPADLRFLPKGDKLVTLLTRMKLLKSESQQRSFR